MKKTFVSLQSLRLSPSETHFSRWPLKHTQMERDLRGETAKGKFKGAKLKNQPEACTAEKPQRRRRRSSWRWKRRRRVSPSGLSSGISLLGVWSRRLEKLKLLKSDYTFGSKANLPRVRLAFPWAERQIEHKNTVIYQPVMTLETPQPPQWTHLGHHRLFLNVLCDCSH